MAGAFQRRPEPPRPAVMPPRPGLCPGAVPEQCHLCSGPEQTDSRSLRDAAPGPHLAPVEAARPEKGCAFKGLWSPSPAGICLMAPDSCSFSPAFYQFDL